MRNEAPYALARCCVPGAGEVELKPLGAGLAHETYRVERDGMRFAMRVRRAAPEVLKLDPRFEGRVLERAAAAGVAPAVRCVDPARGVLVLDWVRGRTWREAETREAAGLARMAGLLRTLHGLSVGGAERGLNPADWIEAYTAAGARAPADLHAGARERVALGRREDVQRVLCHSDLHRLNVIDAATGLMLIDFEYAHLTDPLWDLAAWGINNEFDDTHKFALMAQYLGRRPTPQENERLQRLQWLYQFICLLWSDLNVRLAKQTKPRPAPAFLADNVNQVRRLQARLRASPR